MSSKIGFPVASNTTIARARYIIINYLISHPISKESPIWNSEFFSIKEDGSSFQKDRNCTEFSSLPLKYEVQTQNIPAIDNSLNELIETISTTDIQNSGERLLFNEYVRNLHTILNTQKIEDIIRLLVYIKMRLKDFLLLNLWLLAIDTIIDEFIILRVLSICGYSDDEADEFILCGNSLEKRIIELYEKLQMNDTFSKVYPKLVDLNDKIYEFIPNKYNLLTRFLSFVSSFHTTILCYYLVKMGPKNGERITVKHFSAEKIKEVLSELCIIGRDNDFKKIHLGKLREASKRFLKTLLEAPLSEIKLLDNDSIPESFKASYLNILRLIKLHKELLAANEKDHTLRPYTGEQLTIQDFN